MRLALWITCLLLAGCLGNQGGSVDVSSNSEAPSDTTAVIALSNAKRTIIDSAAERLRHHEYVRERAVSVVDESGETILRHTDTVRFYGPVDDRRAEVLDTTASGSSDGDFWGEYTGRPSEEDTVNWSRRLLEKDPVITSRQGAAYYRYTSLIDTTIGGSRVMRVETRVSPGSDRAGIQWGLFFIEQSTDELVGFELEFLQTSLLFDEESRFSYMLDRTPDGTWVPSHVEINTFLNLPLTKGQHFELETVYIP